MELRKCEQAYAVLEKQVDTREAEISRLNKAPGDDRAGGELRGAGDVQLRLVGFGRPRGDGGGGDLPLDAEPAVAGGEGALLAAEAEGEGVSNAKRRHRRRRRELAMFRYAKAIVRAYWKDPFSPFDLEACGRLIRSGGRHM